MIVFFLWLKVAWYVCLANLNTWLAERDIDCLHFFDLILNRLLRSCLTFAALYRGDEKILADFRIKSPGLVFKLRNKTYDLSGSGTSSIGPSLLGINVAFLLLSTRNLYYSISSFLASAHCAVISTVAFTSVVGVSWTKNLSYLTAFSSC